MTIEESQATGPQMSVTFVHRSLDPELPFRDWPVCRKADASVVDASKRPGLWKDQDRGGPEGRCAGVERRSAGVVRAERHASFGERIRIRFSETSARETITYVYFLTDNEYRKYEIQNRRTETKAIEAQWRLAAFGDRPEVFWSVPESRLWHVIIGLPATCIESVDVVDLLPLRER